MKCIQVLFIQILILLFLFIQVASAKNLSLTEENIQQAVFAEKTAQLHFLKKIVNINSGTMNKKGIYRVGKLLQIEFEKMGFKTHWVYEPSLLHRAGMLIAERKGKKGKRILLIGHLDTVFSKNSTSQSYKQHGDMANGPGVADDKGGTVVILYALKALQAAHALDNATITVVLTGDEEDSGKPTSISRKPLLIIAKKSDVALDFEIAFDLKTATIARRGVSLWTVESHGKEGHSSDIFNRDVGYGAIFELSRILNTMRIQFSGKKYLSVNPGMNLGGMMLHLDPKNTAGNVLGKQNIIAPIAIAKGDFRFLTATQKKSTENEMLSIINQSLEGTSSTISFQAGIPAMSPTENNLQLLNQYSKVSVDLGYSAVKPLDPILRGAGDISHVAAIVPFNLGGLGPVGSGPHSQNEIIIIHDLPIMTARAAVLIYRLTQGR